MILVTGGTGLLGAHLLFQLTENETPVRAIYRNQQKLKQVQSIFQFYDPHQGEARFSSIEWVQGDILDVPFLEEAMLDCTHIYHCAALVSFHRRDFSKLIKINREGTANVVNVALTSPTIKKICHVSSTAAIGHEENGKIVTEKTPWKNTPTTSGYSISKYSAEKEVWRAIEEGLDAVIVNPCVILGAGNWNESSLTLFRTLEKGIRHYPPGANATVDARDVSTIMIRLMNSEISAERFLCIGSNQNFKELMNVISERLQVTPPKREAKRYQVNIVRRLLSFFAFIRGKRSSITKETVNSLFSTTSYDNGKIREKLNFEFRSLEESVDNAIQGRIQS